MCFIVGFNLVSQIMMYISQSRIFPIGCINHLCSVPCLWLDLRGDSTKIVPFLMYYNKDDQM